MTARKPKEERRREIADAAIKIIEERGLREFTAANIAREVGIKDGTIFRHYKDMNEIAHAVLDRLHDVMEAEPRAEGEPLARLEEFVLSRLHAAAVRPGIQSLIFSDQISHALGTDGHSRVAALRNRSREFIRVCLIDASEKGQLREDVDIGGAVLLITGSVMGFLFAAKDGALPGPAKEMERRCWKTIRSMLVESQVTS